MHDLSVSSDRVFKIPEASSHAEPWTFLVKCRPSCKGLDNLAVYSVGPGQEPS